MPGLVESKQEDQGLERAMERWSQPGPRGWGWFQLIKDLNQPGDKPTNCREGTARTLNFN